jgi:hypothetical protein
MTATPTLAIYTSNNVSFIMAQLSMKAVIKKWGQEAEYAITKEMKQLHWRESYKPKHWHELTKKQKEQILETHIFVEQKRDGFIKARKVSVAISNEITSQRRM